MVGSNICKFSSHIILPPSFFYIYCYLTVPSYLQCISLPNCPTTHHPPPTIHHPLPPTTPYHTLPTNHSLPHTPHHPLPTTHSPPPTPYHTLPTTHSLPHTPHYPLPTTHSPLPTTTNHHPLPTPHHPQLINRDPEFRLGCSSASRDQAVTEIKEHAFFSNTPMDPDEEVYIYRTIVTLQNLLVVLIWQLWLLVLELVNLPIHCLAANTLCIMRLKFISSNNFYIAGLPVQVHTNKILVYT